MMREHEIVGSTARSWPIRSSPRASICAWAPSPIACARASCRGASTVLERIEQLDGYPIEISKGAVLEKGCVYVVPLLESLRSREKRHHGFANPKSSTGRLDILTRLITDRSEAFDQVERGYQARSMSRSRRAPSASSSAPARGSTRSASAAARPARRRPRSQRLHERRPAHPRRRRARPISREKLVGVSIDLEGGGPRRAHRLSREKAHRPHRSRPDRPLRSARFLGADPVRPRPAARSSIPTNSTCW